MNRLIVASLMEEKPVHSTAPGTAAGVYENETPPTQLKPANAAGHGATTKLRARMRSTDGQSGNDEIGMRNRKTESRGKKTFIG